MTQNERANLGVLIQKAVLTLITASGMRIAETSDGLRLAAESTKAANHELGVAVQRFALDTPNEEV